MKRILAAALSAFLAFASPAIAADNYPATAGSGLTFAAKNIGGVAVAAKNTTQGANDTQKASQELSQMAARLQTVTSKFTF